MKIKKILSLTLFVPLFTIGILTGCSSKKENSITVAEVTHSIFYAPLYVAKNKGYFKDEGIDINIITTPGVMRNISLNK